MILKNKKILFLLTIFSFTLSNNIIASGSIDPQYDIEDLKSLSSSVITETSECQDERESPEELLSPQSIHDEALREYRSGSQEQDRHHALKKRPDLLPDTLREMAPFITLAYRYGDVVEQTEANIKDYEARGWKFAPFYADKGIESLELAHRAYNKVAEMSGQQLPVVVKDKPLAERDIAGFVAVKKSHERVNGYDIAIACRGTQSVADGITDALFFKSELTAFGFAGKGHKGFADAAKTALPGIYEAMRNVLRAFEVLPPDSMDETLDLFKLASDRQMTFNIYPMGHSLGGAIAKNVGVFIAQDSMLGTVKSDDCALTSLIECQFKPEHAEWVNVVVVNVGGPRTSDSDNAEEVERILGGAHHIVNFFDYCDPVPFQPLQLFGFSHAGVIIPLNTMTKYYYPMGLDDDLLPKLAADMAGMSRQIMAHGQQLLSTGAVAYATPTSATLMAFGSCVVDLLKETVLACHSSKRYVDMIINTRVYDSWFYQDTSEESAGSSWNQAWFGDHAVTERTNEQAGNAVETVEKSTDSYASVLGETQDNAFVLFSESVESIVTDSSSSPATDMNEANSFQNTLNGVKDKVLDNWSAFKESVESFFSWGAKQIEFFMG